MIPAVVRFAFCFASRTAWKGVYGNMDAAPASVHPLHLLWPQRTDPGLLGGSGRATFTHAQFIAHTITKKKRKKNGLHPQGDSAEQ